MCIKFDDCGALQPVCPGADFSYRVAWSSFFVLTQWYWELLPVYEIAVEGANHFAPPWFATAYIVVAVLFIFWRTLSSLSDTSFSD